MKEDIFQNIKISE